MYCENFMFLKKTAQLIVTKTMKPYGVIQEKLDQ